MKRFLQPLIAALLVASVSGIMNRGPGFAQQQPTPSQIKSLAVRIETADIRGAGTDNAIYFDIGPLAWKLDLPHHNDFERGSRQTYELIRDGIDLQTKQAVTLKRSDILWLRLQKKGIAGVTGTGDGFGGAWYPSSIALIVNGLSETPISIDEPLNSKCWFWRSGSDDHFNLNAFAHSLRMNPNRGLNWLGKVSGIITTTTFKNRGISGWLKNPEMRECVGDPPRRKRSLPLPALCVSGEVVAKASSSDGLETIDLKVIQIETSSSDPTMKPDTISLDLAHDLAAPRFIRIENRFAHNRVKPRERVRICGSLQWDTDREGWWEIHPRSSADLPAKRRSP